MRIPRGGPWRVFWLALLVYNANLAYLGSGDTFPNIIVPMSLVNHGDVFLERYNIRIQGAPPRHEPYWAQESKGHVLSNYPPMTSALAAPIYLVPARIAKAAGVESDPRRFFLFCRALGKVAASLFTAAAVACVYLALRRLYPAVAGLLTLAFAFGSSAFSIASQGLWQHSAAIVLIALSVLMLARESLDRRGVGFAAIACALAVLARPTALTLVLALNSYVLHRRRRFGVLFFVAVAAFSLAQIAYNVALYDDARGGYAMILAENAVRQGEMAAGTAQRFAAGVAGLLVSPSEGILVFSPYLVFAAAAVPLVWRRAGLALPGGLMVRYLSLGAFSQLVLFANYPAWWGGVGYGPRYLTESYVPLTLLLAPAIAALAHRRAARRAFAALVAASAVFFGIGVFGNPFDWYVYYDVDKRHEQLWEIRRGEIANALAVRSEFGNLLYDPFRPMRRPRTEPETNTRRPLTGGSR
jgi:hypothetical protein